MKRAALLLGLAGVLLASTVLSAGPQPSEHDQHIARGHLLMAKGLAGQAALEFGDAIEEEPDNLDAYIYRAKANWLITVELSPLNDVERALGIDRAAALERIGDVFSGVDVDDLAGLFYERASEDLQFASEHAGHSRPLPDPLIDRLREAADGFMTATELSPSYFAAYVDLGLTYLWWGEYERAIRPLDEAAALRPTNPQVYAYRGSAYRAIGDLEQAVSDFTKSLELNASNVLVYVDRSFAYIDMEEYDRAIADATTAISIWPGSANAYYNRGFARSALSQYDLAIADFTRTIELDESSTYAYHMRGMAYAALGDVTKAVADLKAALSISDDATYGRWVESIIKDLESGRNTQPACLLCRPT